MGVPFSASLHGPALQLAGPNYSPSNEGLNHSDGCFHPSDKGPNYANGHCGKSGNSCSMGVSFALILYGPAPKLAGPHYLPSNEGLNLSYLCFHPSDKGPNHADGLRCHKSDDGHKVQ
jgi:hypothetical protein